MSEASQVDSLVRASFTVKDSYARDEAGASEYSVVYDQGTRAAFRELCRKLAPLGFTPRLVGTQDDASLIVVPRPETPKSSARTPVFLAAISAISIVATGWGVGLVN
ncbi:MAG TPA: hypothetical protein VLY65_01750, partial [Nitrososphaerales archaeon]|nr:hypothetical protein [Nitrososphaerales archaeon]